MPWTAESFRSKHNHNLTSAQAEHAARVANAILKRGEPEGVAIAAANKMAERAAGGPLTLASGGLAGLGHFQAPHVIAPPHVLLRGHPHASGPFNRPGFEIGGSPMGISGSAADPWWTRSDARGEDVHPGGLVGGATSGRADHVPTSVAADSYVLPADIVSGLGAGNSLNGASVIDKMLHSEPYGIQPPRIGGRGMSIPRAPRPPTPNYSAGGPLDNQLQGFAAGRVPHGQGAVPVKLSGGEYVVNPDRVAAIGHGDVELGHEILDAFVKKRRAQTIKEMKALPGPKRD